MHYPPDAYRRNPGPDSAGMLASDYGPACAAADPEPSIRLGQARLASELNGLEKCLEMLREKLGPVTRPAHPDSWSLDSGRPAPLRSPVGESLAAFADQVERTRRMVEDIAARVDA